MSETVSREELQKQIENTQESGTVKVSYEDNAELKKQEWFRQAREKFIGIEKMYHFDSLMLRLDLKELSFTKNQEILSNRSVFCKKSN